jgi:hypothetical protein
MEVLKERADSRVALLGTPGIETDVRKISVNRLKI